MTSPSPGGRWPRTLDALLVALFLVAIAAPGLTMVLLPPTGEAMSATGEKQPPIGPMLHQAASTWETAGILKEWFRTRFAFRDALIEAGATIKVSWLGVSSSKRVLLGKEGWLFFSDERNIESHRRVQPFSAGELARWRQILGLWQAACASSRAHLVVVIAPDKSTVYPEFLPDWTTLLGPQSRLDQFAELFVGREGVDLLDLRPAFAAARRDGVPLYYRTDTHWNELGGYVAARELALVLARHYPDLAPPPPVTGATVEVVAKGGDMSRFLGVQDQFTDEEVRFTPPVARLARVQTPASARWTRDMTYMPQLYSVRAGAPIPRAVFYRDSFGNALIPNVAELFGQALYLWTSRVEPELIKQVQPDVVVVEILERYLMKEPYDLLQGRF